MKEMDLGQIALALGDLSSFRGYSVHYKTVMHTDEYSTPGVIVITCSLHEITQSKLDGGHLVDQLVLSNMRSFPKGPDNSEEYKERCQEIVQAEMMRSILRHVAINREKFVNIPRNFN